MGYHITEGKPCDTSQFRRVDSLKNNSVPVPPNIMPKDGEQKILFGNLTLWTCCRSQNCFFFIYFPMNVMLINYFLDIFVGHLGGFAVPKGMQWGFYLPVAHFTHCRPIYEFCYFISSHVAVLPQYYQFSYPVLTWYIFSWLMLPGGVCCRCSRKLNRIQLCFPLCLLFPDTFAVVISVFGFVNLDG